MKRIFSLLLIMCVALSSHAVLKEQDLSRTLGVLRLELERNYRQQKSFLVRYERQSEEQHAQLVDYMKKSEQIALILYSQKTDFTLDVAYACQQATDLYRALHKNNLPYEQIRRRMVQEVARYDSLIQALKALPPAIGKKNWEMTATDSLLAEVETAKVDDEPYILTDKELEDRAKCIEYATALRNNLKKMIEAITKDNRYYTQVSEQVERLNNYAQERYVLLRQSIFVNGGENYFQILTRLPRYFQMASRDFSDKYLPLEGGENASEWRGPIVLGVSIFMLFYIFIATLLSNIIMRGGPWLMKLIAPKRAERMSANINHRFLNEEEYKKKRGAITLAVGIAVFAIVVMVIKQFMHRNLFIMAANLMVNMAWLMEAIIISLLIRLKGKQMKYGFKIYMPFIMMAFIVIVFRIVLIPNTIVNLIYPPILLAFVIWQLRAQRNNKDKVPLSDTVYSGISLLTMLVGCVLAWVGFTMLAVQIMIWWTFQLAFIQTITCLYDLMRMYEEKVLIRKVKLATHKEDLDHVKLVKRMRKGDFFTTTWVFDFINKTIIPVLAVLSVLLSIYLSVRMFELGSIVEYVFFHNFLDVPEVIQLSLFKLCLTLACYFLFRYINYAVRSYYNHWFRKAKKNKGNETLSRNVIAIIVWGAYVIFILSLLQVPKSGISVVTAGLATGMGFAMKDLLENFFYGISLMTGRLRVGDYIECDGIQGKVESITYQSTSIITLDGSVMAFLNSALFNKNFKNLTRNHSYELQKIPVGVAYGTNVEKVRKMLVEALEKLRTQTPDGRDVVNPNQPISVLFADFGESSVDLFVVVWVLVDQKAVFLAKIKETIYNTLNENHIEIPFPQRDVYLRNVES